MERQIQAVIALENIEILAMFLFLGPAGSAVFRIYFKKGNK
jgi:hypothetical protein